MRWRTLESNHRVKTRKAHVCEGCGRLWPAGILMDTWTGVYSGSAPVRIYICLVCDRFWWGTRTAADLELDGVWPNLDPDRYAKTEAKLALYVIEAGVAPIAPRLLTWR